MKNINCPFCSKHNTRHCYPSIADPNSIYGFNYVYCTNCKIAYLNPFPDDTDIAGHYLSYADKHAVQNISEFKIDSMRNIIIKRLNLSKSDDAILDIGCGKGEVLYCLLEEGYNIEGVDPYFRANQNAPVLNEKIHTKNLLETNFPDNHFSVIMLWSVLEHIAEPMPLLEEISRITRRGGRLVISVPNFNTHQHRLMKNHWPGLGPPEHLFVYTDSGLAKLLGKLGFSVHKKFKDPIYDQWMLKNSTYRMLQSKLDNRTEFEQVSKNFNKIERSLISMFSFSFVKLESLAGNSSTANIIFKKK